MSAVCCGDIARVAAQEMSGRTVAMTLNTCLSALFEQNKELFLLVQYLLTSPLGECLYSPGGSYCEASRCFSRECRCLWLKARLPEPQEAVSKLQHPSGSICHEVTSAAGAEGQCRCREGTGYREGLWLVQSAQVCSVACQHQSTGQLLHWIGLHTEWLNCPVPPMPAEPRELHTR